MTWDEFLARRKDFFGCTVEILMNPVYYRTNYTGTLDGVTHNPVEGVITLSFQDGSTYTFAEAEATLHWHRDLGLVICEKDGSRLIIAV